MLSLRNALGRSLGQGKKIFKVEKVGKVGASKNYELESLSLLKEWMYPALTLRAFREDHSHI